MVPQGNRVVRDLVVALLATLAVAGCADQPTQKPPTAPDLKAGAPKEDAVRFATFNASLNRNAAGQLVADLSTTTNAQARTVAEIIQRNRPAVLLINEFDFVAGGEGSATLPRQLPVDLSERRPADRLPLPIRLAVKHGHPIGFRPRQ